MNARMALPILIVVLSNVFYHTAAKSAPEGVNTFASLSVTYAVGAAVSLLLFFLTSRGTSLPGAYRELNWSSYVLGFAIVGLEAGFLLAYKAGWSIGTAQLVASAFLAVVLLFVGRLFFGESVNTTKLLGVAVCLAGLWLINK